MITVGQAKFMNCVKCSMVRCERTRIDSLLNLTLIGKCRRNVMYHLYAIENGNSPQFP